jgi:hypothetical protein
MLHKSKKLAAVVVGALTLGMGAAAYAYFTTGGSGTGSANVGTASAIVLSATTDTTLYPGGPAADLAIEVTNPGPANQHVDTVSLTSIDTPIGCNAAWFTMSPVTVDSTLAPGASTTVHGMLTMTNTATSQDACQGGALTLHVSSN